MGLQAGADMGPACYVEPSPVEPQHNWQLLELAAGGWLGHSPRAGEQGLVLRLWGKCLLLWQSLPFAVVDRHSGVARISQSTRMLTLACVNCRHSSMERHFQLNDGMAPL